MRTIVLFAIISLFGIMSSCDRPDNRQLAKAEAVMETAPDSALAILDSIDTATLTSAQSRALYALLSTQARIKKYELLTDDSLITTAVTYFENHGSDSNLMKSLFYQGEILHNNGNHSKAIIPAMQAREIAIEKHDIYWQAKASELIANILNSTYLYDEAINYCKEAALLYKKANKETNHRFLLCDLAIQYNNIGAHDRSLEILDSIKNLAMRAPADSNLIFYSQNIIFANYYSSKNHEKAIEAYDSLLKPSYIPLISQKDHIWAALSKMENGDMSDITSIVQMINDNTIPSIDNITKYNLLSKYYFTLGKYKESKTYTDSAMSCQDSIVENILKQSVIGSQRDFFIHHKNLAQNKSKKLSSIIIVSSIIFFFVIITFIIFFIQRMKIKNMKIDKSMNEIYNLTMDITHKNENIRSLETQIKLQGKNLQMEIESAFHSNWSILNSLCKKYIQMEESGISSEKLVKEVYAQVSEMRKHEKLDWIKDSVDKYKNGIVTKLKEQCDFLKEKDITFISLLYAGFSAKVICFFMEMGTKNFYAKRSRLIERINKSNAKDKEEFTKNMNDKTN